MTTELEQIVGMFAYNFRTKFASAMKRDLAGATGQIREFGRRLEEQYGKPSDAQREFEVVATNMRVALLEGVKGVGGYDNAVAARKHVASYNNKSGTRLPGALRATLESPTMAIATPNGIEYLDHDLLNSQARHWKRLNFGAQGPFADGPGNVNVPVKYDKRILFYAGSKSGPRPGFALPPGRFVSPETGKRVAYGPSEGSSYSGTSPTVDRFFPGKGGRAPSLTRGIQGRHYIDAGFIVFARDFPVAIAKLQTQWLTGSLPKTPPPPFSTIA